jgi:glycosyltransferase involved in cell wall biosynthesis
MVTASIVIDNYNYARYLPQAIESALSQTFPNVDVIVVDDGSTDESRSIIEGYGNSITPIFKQNGGMASTYNAAFPFVDGQVVIILDADDVLLAHAVETVIPFFEVGDVAKVQWPLKRIDSLGKETGGLEPDLPLTSGNLKERAIELGPDCYTSSPTSGNAWSHEFLKQVLPMPQVEFRQHADSYLISLAPLYGKISAVEEPLGLYRVHGENDYASKSVAERNARNLAMYDLRCGVLAAKLDRLVIAYDPAEWKGKGSAYSWMQDLDAFGRSVSEFVPVDSKFILVDDAQLGNRGGHGTFIAAREALPFIERNGVYWGPPADDDQAIAELARMQQGGAKAIVFAWPSFWWFDQYQGFHQYLRSHYDCLTKNSLLIAFALV